MNTCDSHGAPLGDEEIALTRKALGWDEAPFVVPDDIYKEWNLREVGQAVEDEWNKQFAKYETTYPELAREFLRRMHNDMPSDWAEKSNAFIQASQEKTGALATRKASLACFKYLRPNVTGNDGWFGRFNWVELYGVVEIKNADARCSFRELY